MIKTLSAAGFAALLSFSSAFAAEDEQTPYSPPVGKNYPKNVYFGDTHLHTRRSADAFSVGNENLSPADAYRFARGQAVTAHTGQQVQLRRPLDFLVLADHGEYLNGYFLNRVNDPRVTDTDAGRRWKYYADEGLVMNMIGEFTASMDRPDEITPFPLKTRKSIWEDVAQTADDYNEPGVFTAFTGYEWTVAVEGNNLHRVIIYKDGAEKAAQFAPFTGQDSKDPEDLWQALADYEEATGGEVMAIPHNGNISNGMMFSDKRINGDPLDEAYANMRSRWEPLYEVTQVKGDGEAHPFLSPDDEFADYETWDADNIGRTAQKENWMLKHEYARGALKLGLKYEEELGTNPFKFGMIGATDSHTSLATAAEDNFFGKFPESEPSPARTDNIMVGVLWKNWQLASSGYAGVWATENTREAVFAAMKRKEVYTTTGSRIVVRFFGGWGYDGDETDRPHYLDDAYAGGVPMGGDLTQGPKGEAPKFIVEAVKDPDGANLDRVQIIKGWLDADGNTQEKVYDVALSDGRVVDQETGKAPPVGSTVDVANATYANTIGEVRLATVWQDPDYDPDQRAFYYARVLEIPTPRWTAYDAKYFNMTMPEEVPLVQQDRAYTSPIWYTP
jgi:hypothetical protein